MPYNNIITRSEAAALIPEDAANYITQNAPGSSIIMGMMPTTRVTMSRKVKRFPVLSVLPSAYWVATSDTGLKQTSEANWENVNLEAEELAVIIPIPEAVLDDAEYDIWGEIKPTIAEAFGKAFDEAVIHGTNAPSSFPDDLITQIVAAGHDVDLSNFPDLYGAIMDENGVLSMIEQDGFMADGYVAALTMKGKLRGCRDANGQPIFNVDPAAAGKYILDGETLAFPKNGALDPTAALMLAGAWKNLVWGLRQDLTYKVLDQAVITDNSSPPQILYNLAQNDMVALRVTMRLGWALPNPANRVQATAANRCAFALLKP